MSSDTQTKEGELSVAQHSQRVLNKGAHPAQRMSSFRTLLEVKGKAIFDALPAMIPRERMAAVVMGNIRDNPKLLDCEPASVLNAVAQACTLGLSLDGPVGHAYLIPYKKECKLIPGYKGLLHLAHRSTRVLDIQTEVVRASDTFEFRKGDDACIRHIPSQEDNESEEITHVYVILTLKGGAKIREVWTRNKVETHKKKYAQGTNRSDSPWNTSWDKMALKTVLRSVLSSGKIPLSVEWLDLVSATDEPHTNYQPGGDDVRTVSSLNELADSVTSELTEEEQFAEDAAAAEQQDLLNQ